MGERVRSSDEPQATATHAHAQYGEVAANLSTDAEHKLWYHLRARRLDGLKFRRQHPIPPYVADFYCDELKLVIELDGSQHDGQRDAIRTQALQRQGLFVLRFWDNQVLQQIGSVLEAILDFARGRTLSPTPLPVGEGLQEL